MQRAILLRFSGAERIDMAMDMSLFARELALAGLRRDYPDWSDRRLRRELLRRLYPEARIPALYE